MSNDELVALAENIEGSGRFSFTSDYILLPCLHKRDRDLIASALRLASRQEVSVGELAGFFVTEFPHLLTMSTQIEVARALLAEYSITRREG